MDSFHPTASRLESVGDVSKGNVAIERKDAINKLPFDMLRHIFLLAVTFSPKKQLVQDLREYRYEYVVAPSLSKEPMSFTYVCSWWRIVALSIPELWKAISGTQDWTLGTTYGVLRVWMNNVRICCTSLDFHLDCQLPNSTAADAHEARRIRRVLQLFWQHLGMARSLRLGFDPNLLEALAELVQHKSPGDGSTAKLEDVHFTFRSSVRGGSKEINSIVAWLGSLPALRRFQWPSELMIGRAVNMERLSWEKLEVITLRFPMNLREIVEFVSRCTSAKSVSLTTLRWTLDDNAASIDHSLIITLPLLTSLHLNDLDTGISLFDHITLPALKVLSMRFYPHFRFAVMNAPPGPLVGLQLKKFLIRSQCALDELIIHHHTKYLDPAKFYTYPGIAKLHVLDIFHANTANITEEFLAEGGREQLDSLGIEVLVLWDYRNSELQEECHIGWKDKFRMDEHIKHVYECITR